MGNKGEKLSPKQRRFVKEYLVGLNAKQAAIRAGYSSATAHVQGSRLLSKANVQEAVQKGAQKIEEKLDLSRERIAAEYAKLAFSDMAHYGEWDADGRASLRASGDLGDRTAAIQEITVSEQASDGQGGTKRLVKFKLHPKREALDSLCKMQGYFAPTRVEASGPNGGPIPVAVDLSMLSDEELAVLERVNAKLALSAVEAPE